MRWLNVSVLCLLGACAGPATTPAAPSTPEAPPTASASTVDWARAVETTASAIEAEHPGAVVRVVVLDDSGASMLASHGDVETAAPTGSTMKPLTVYAALERGLDPSLTIDASAPVTIDGETIQDARNNGELSLAQAIAVSSNIAVAKVLQTVPWTEVYTDVGAMVPLPNVEGSSMIEGVGQLDGFTTAVPLHTLVRAYATMAVDEKHGAAVLEMLKLAVTDAGTGEQAAVAGLEVLGKTGTARNDGTTDAVFVGRVRGAGTSAWIGVSVHDEGEDIYGGSVSAPAFAAIAKAALQSRESP